MWLLDDSNDHCDIPDPLPTLSCNAEPATSQELTGYQQKKVLREQIATLSAQLLSTDVKRLTIRRKFMWLDFKSAMSSKIQPRSTLKVVFSGEPAVDDGGPRRELFSGKLLQCSFLLIVMGTWHSVKSMYVVGVLLTSIEDEMYSFRSYIVIRAFGLLNLFTMYYNEVQSVTMY